MGRIILLNGSAWQKRISSLIALEAAVTLGQDVENEVPNLKQQLTLLATVCPYEEPIVYTKSRNLIKRLWPQNSLPAAVCSQGAPKNTNDQTKEDSGKSLSSGFTFDVFPNPVKANTLTTIQVTQPTKGTLRILDVNGRLLEQYEIDSTTPTFTQEITFHTPGVYFAVYFDEKVGIKTKKIVAQ